MNNEAAETLWREIAKAAGPTAQQVDELLKNPPSEITRTVTLKGASAVIFSYVSKTLELGLGLSEDEATAYILRIGAEYEMKKRELMRRVIKDEEEDSTAS